MRGHVGRDCPNRPCSSCGLPSHGHRACERPPVWSQHCHRCGITGHLLDVSLFTMLFFPLQCYKSEISHLLSGFSSGLSWYMETIPFDSKLTSLHFSCPSANVCLKSNNFNTQMSTEKEHSLSGEIRIHKAAVLTFAFYFKNICFRSH